LVLGLACRKLTRLVEVTHRSGIEPNVRQQLLDVEVPPELPLKEAFL
jgi:hypothetical protein